MLRKNILLMLVASLIALCIGELILRLLPISDRMGWSRVPPLSRRAEKLSSKAKIKIVCLGDSFVEWRCGEGVNIFDHVQKAFANRGCLVVNLGNAGVDLARYITNYNHYVKIKPDIIFLCLTLGNDLREYPSFSIIDQISIEKPKPKFELRQFFKRHILMANALSHFCKRHLQFMRSGFFENTLKALKKRYNLSEAYIQDRIKQIDPGIIELAKSDAINVWLPARGIARPNYYKDCFSMNSPAAISHANSVISIIDEFYKKQEINNFFVILFPESNQVSQEYDDFFKKCGFNLEDFPLSERREITRYIKDRLAEKGIRTIDVTTALEKKGDCFVDYDTHLNKNGHQVIGEMIIDFLQANFFGK